MGELTRIIKLDATDSTNLYLKNLALSTKLNDYTVVVANKQFKGRGQMGTVWESERGKNLTFSILKNFDAFEASKQFNLNMVVSLAIYSTLIDLNVPNLKVKWPNDIMSGSSKVCGILIENVLNGSFIKKAIIGVGLNVNQTSFGKLSKASSLSLVTGHVFELDYVLECILEKLRSLMDGMEKHPLSSLQSQYETLLFRKDKVSTFKKGNDKLFSAIIRGVSSGGQLILELDDGILQRFSMKEVSLQY